MKRVLLSVAIMAVIITGLKSQTLKSIPFSKYRIKQQTCSGLLHHSGSRIYIPDNALLHEDGTLCLHEIELRYRELHTPSDIVVSGLTMNYMDGQGNLKHLESTGMFDIDAQCEYGKLKIKQGKTIQVRFASKKKMEDISAFVYDENKKVWRSKNANIVDYGVITDSKDTESLWGSASPPPFEQFSTYEDEFWGDDWCCDGNDDIVSGYNDFLKKKAEIFKSMDIDEFGIYNYDRIIKEDNRIPMVARFELENSKGGVSMIYVAYDKINSVISYPEYDWKKNFALLPGSDYKLFAIGKDGRVALLEEKNKPKDLELLRNKTYTFKLTLKEKVENKFELIAQTGIE